MTSRACTKCGIVKPLDEFSKSKYQAKDGYTFRCKLCIQEYRRAHYAESEQVRNRASEYAKKRREENRDHVNEISRKSYRKNKTRPDRGCKSAKDGVKTCSKCQSEKPISEFRRHSGNLDNLQYWCKKCQNKYESDRFKSDDLFRKQRVAKTVGWAERNPGKVREYSRIATRKYYAAHKEKSLEYNRKYRRDHPEFSSAFHNARRARKTNAEGRYTPSEFRNLCDKYGMCACVAEEM